MPLTIILSGPRFSEPQARTALASNGLGVRPYTAGQEHGLPPFAAEEIVTEEQQSFVVVDGDDVDRARAAVDSLGWCLRMHYETPEPAPLSLEQQLAAKLADMQRQIDELKVGANGG